MTDYELDVQELRAQVDPLSGDMWQCAPITIGEVRAAITSGVCEDRSWATVKDAIEPDQQRTFHIARIATLSREVIGHGDDPIIIAIGPDSVWVYDGSHRIGAAIVRQQATLRVRLAPSDPALIPATFPSATEVGHDPT